MLVDNVVSMSQGKSTCFWTANCALLGLNAIFVSTKKIINKQLKVLGKKIVDCYIEESIQTHTIQQRRPFILIMDILEIL